MALTNGKANSFEVQKCSKDENDLNQVDVDDRGKWDNKAEFILSCLGYAVGFGNVWRFPFLCYKNGGAAFLIPYAIMLFLAGFPLFFMELAIGQYSSLGPNVLFSKIGPIFKGVGYSMIAISVLISIYFNLIFAWTLFYLFASFSSVLPWSSCDNSFNSPNCYIQEKNENCIQEGLVYFNNSCTPKETLCNITGRTLFNDTHCIGMTNMTSSELIDIESVIPRISSSEDFYRNRVLGVTGRSWENMGDLNWDIVGCLALAWLIIGACMIKGVKSSGKVVYFTATFPYVVLMALLVRGVTLDGAYDGIEFYFLKPNITKLLEVEVWNDAATQIFYSLGSSAGVLITLSSYNPFHNNCLRDAILIAGCNCLTSVFAGFVIFSILGFMAHELQVPVKDVVKSGSGLAFVAYPEAVARMPISTLWSVLFFLMLVTLGIDSQFSYMETMATSIFDQFPKLRHKKTLVTALITLFLFVCGITMCLDGGVYMFELFVWYSSGISLLFLGLVEVLVIQYGYGFEKFIHNIRNDMGIHIPKPIYGYLFIMWRILTPLSLIVILVSSIYSYLPAYYGNYVFPNNIQLLGWFLCATSVICIPLGAIWAIFFSGKPLKELMKSKDISSEKKLGVSSKDKSSDTMDTFKYTYENQAFDGNKV